MPPGAVSFDALPGAHLAPRCLALVSLATQDFFNHVMEQHARLYPGGAELAELKEVCNRPPLAHHGAYLPPRWLLTSRMVMPAGEEGCARVAHLHCQVEGLFAHPVSEWVRGRCR